MGEGDGNDCGAGASEACWALLPARANEKHELKTGYEEPLTIGVRRCPLSSSTCPCHPAPLREFDPCITRRCSGVPDSAWLSKAHRPGGEAQGAER